MDSVSTPFYRFALAVDRRALLAFCFPLLIYLLTMAPTVYNLDSAEFSTAVPTGGIIRATGYPFYLIIGRIWSYLPIGDVAYRMNLFSAVCGALTIMLTDRILRRWEVRPWAAFGALGMLACATYFWGMSLIAEVYTLHTVFVTIIILLLFHWADDPSPPRLGLLTVTVGLGLSHHAATVLLIPGCLFFLLTVDGRAFLQPKSLLIGTLCGLLGLSIYLYIPLIYTTNPMFNYAGTYDETGTFNPVNLQTVEGLWWLVSGKVFANQMLAYTWSQYWVEVVSYGEQLAQTFFGFGLGPGLLGLVMLFRRDWRWGGTFLLMFLFNAWFYIGYNVVDKKTMFLPTYVIWAVWMGIGYQWLLDWLNQDYNRRYLRQGSKGLPPTTAIPWETWLLRGFIVALVFFALSWNWSLVTLADEWEVREQAEQTLSTVEPSALIFGWWDVVPPLQYLQMVEGHRPDVQIINRFLIDSRDMRTLIESQMQSRPIYIDELPMGLHRTLNGYPEAGLVRVLPREEE